MTGPMRIKLLIGAVSVTAIALLVSEGLTLYAYTSCGQYRLFEPPCSKLLSTADEQAFLEENQTVINELKQVEPGWIDVLFREEARCPGKSMLTIGHPSEDDCDGLNKILHRDVFDIPYSIFNY